MWAVPRLRVARKKLTIRHLLFEFTSLSLDFASLSNFVPCSSRRTEKQIATAIFLVPLTADARLSTQLGAAVFVDDVRLKEYSCRDV